MTRRQTPEPPPPLLVCTVCGGRYFDDQTGQRMHLVITGHQPEQEEQQGGPAE